MDKFSPSVKEMAMMFLTVILVALFLRQRDVRKSCAMSVPSFGHLSSRVGKTGFVGGLSSVCAGSFHYDHVLAKLFYDSTFSGSQVQWCCIVKSVKFRNRYKCKK